MLVKATLGKSASRSSTSLQQSLSSLQPIVYATVSLREAVRELAPDLQPISRPLDACELVIRVNNDMALSAFFQSMFVYFADDEEPPEALLKLKLKELLTSILVSPGNPTLSAYFRSLAMCDAPPLPAIMEANFCNSLPLDASQRCAIAAFPRSSGRFADAMGPLRQSG